MKIRSQAVMEFLRAFSPFATLTSKARKIRARGISHRSIPRDCRGQAAMEFLLTYGWAILAVVIAISAMAYFGVLSSTGLAAQFMPEMCVMPQGIDCLDHVLRMSNPVGGLWCPGGDKKGNDLEIYLIANKGQRIIVQDIKLEGSSAATFLPQGEELSNNKEKKFVATMITVDGCNAVVEEGEPYSLELEVQYKNIDTQLIHYEKGYIRGKKVYPKI